MVSWVVMIGVTTQACLCRRQQRIPPPSRTSSSADGGLRLVLSPAPRCRHHHCGYMGVATHVGGAPCPCVIVIVVGSTRWCGSRYPCRRIIVLMSRSWSTGIASCIGGRATLPLHCCHHWRCMAVEALVAPASCCAVLSSLVMYGVLDRVSRVLFIVAVEHPVGTRIVARISRASPTTRPTLASSTSRTHEGCCFNRGVWVAASCCQCGIGCMGGRVNTRYVSLHGARVIR